MNAFFLGFILLLIWAATLSLTAIWSRRDTVGRATIIALFILSIPLGSTLFSYALGNHRPITIEQFQQNENLTYRLLGYKILYEKRIYLYIDTEGAPLALELPWNLEAAEDLQDVFGELLPGDSVFVEIPYEKSLDENPPVFYSAPQQKFMPDKIIPEDPVEYERTT